VLTIIDEALVDERVMIQQRRRAISNEEIHWRPRERSAQIVEQRRRQYDIAEPPKL
jgi:hypothetical protein